jgi:hypothetical protein
MPTRAVSLEKRWRTAITVFAARNARPEWINIEDGPATTNVQSVAISGRQWSLARLDHRCVRPDVADDHGQEFEQLRSRDNSVYLPALATYH